MTNKSFYFKGADSLYEVIPEEDGIYTIFKDDLEYIQIRRQEKGVKWFRIDYKTDLPIIEENDEVDAIGRVIVRFLNSQT